MVTYRPSDLKNYFNSGKKDWSFFMMFLSQMEVGDMFVTKVAKLEKTSNSTFEIKVDDDALSRVITSDEFK